MIMMKQKTGMTVDSETISMTLRKARRMLNLAILMTVFRRQHQLHLRNLYLKHLHFLC